MANLADYHWLTGNEAARHLDDLAVCSDPVHRQLERLRKTLSTERAGLVVQQIELRRRGRAKFGDLAAKMFFTDVGLQQSTDFWIARYKSLRLGADQPIVDYCTGIGGDLLGFAERAPCSGWDQAAEIVCLANANLRAAIPAHKGKVRIGSVEEYPPTANDVWHLDPDRRTDGRRSTQLQWHSPGPETVDEWLTASPSGAIKLAPASTVPDSWAQQAELEWISRDRECRQQAVWFGRLANQSGQRRATLVSSQEDGSVAGTFAGSPTEMAEITDEVREYLYDTDPAIRAAGLTGAIASESELFALGDGAAYLTGNSAVANSLLSRFRVQEVLPLRTGALAKHLQTLGIGSLEIKKRGIATDPERLRKQLKLRGDQSASLVLTSLGSRQVAILARRDD